MRRYGLTAATALMFAVLAPDLAHAASLRISPIGVDMPSSDRAAAITIANTDAEPVSLQIRLYKWSQVDGEEKLDPATDMFVSPPAITVPAGKSYTIRVARPTASPVDGELSYRLLIDELPKPIDPRTVGQGVKMVLRTSMPIFIADKKAIATLAWSVWQDADGLHAQVVNTGRRHAKIAGLSLQPASGPAISFGAGLNGYVLAGAIKRFDLKAEGNARLPQLVTGSPVKLTAKNDALDILATVLVAARKDR
ncbi:MAG: molecular chaperone [Pseudomonadota bacterium]